MFKVSILDEYDDICKEFDDAMQIQVLSEHEMELKFPEILDAIGIRSNYLRIADSAGNHFYPLYIYSARIG